MAEFLAGDELGKAIKKICRGRNVRCAVAFWGNGAAKALFGSRYEQWKKARVICDLTMGGTNPVELEKLGVPKSRNIRHIEGLHAKVYLSDSGLVVTSANASENGVGFSQRSAKLTEAGSFAKAGSASWQAAGAWFEDQWSTAEKITRDELDLATERWRRRQKFAPKLMDGERRLGKLGLLDNILLRPEIFDGFEFVLTTSRTDPAIIREAERKVSRALPEDDVRESGKRERLRGYDHFGGWGKTCDDWPENFISVHQNDNGSFGQAGFRTPGIVIEVIVDGDETDVLFARRRKKQDFPDLAAFIKNMNLADDSRAAKLIKNVVPQGGGAILTAEKLSKVLAKISASGKQS